LKNRPARLVFPALRWSAAGRFDVENYTVEDALRAGVGGFILFGGPADAAQQIIEQTQSRCDYALLFGSDMERGAGQQLDGMTQIAPNGALGFLDNLDVTARAAETTALEARAAGINLIFGPVADLDNERRNPIIGTRSFGAAPSLVARHVDAWVRGCHRGGALACAKHFPGHGRTTQDSHATLPHVTASSAAIDDDLDPFRAAIAAGVDAIMTAHVVYDAIDAVNPATLSHAIVTDLLRTRLHFDGIVATDGLGMKGIREAAGGDEARASIRALNAGCDVLLYSEDCARTIDALRAELGRTLSAYRVDEARERVARAADAVAGAVPLVKEAEPKWALDAAVLAIHSLHGGVAAPRSIDVVNIDDDTGGPYAPPSRSVFIETLESHGFDVRPTSMDATRSMPGADASRAIVVALYSEIRAWKGEPRLSSHATETLRRVRALRSDAIVVLFGHPRLAEYVDAASIVVAWGGEHIMQRAAATWLAQTGGRG
jgi:beta-glucosidase-like glycosyl hydrolase